MSLYTMDRERAATMMRRLSGEFCTPSYLRDYARELSDAGLMRFSEWPSGLWIITEKGRAFLADAD